MTKRREVIDEGTRPAGQGADGEEYGVVSLRVRGERAGRVKRKRPCKTCPWRKDAQVGRFPAEAYRHSAETSYDASLRTFACHESGAAKPATCAGFLLVNADHNLSVRLGMSYDKLTLADVEAGDAVLYESYEAMAVANGVDPLEPVLDLCRGNRDPEMPHERVRRRARERQETGWKPKD